MRDMKIICPINPICLWAFIAGLEYSTAICVDAIGVRIQIAFPS